MRDGVECHQWLGRWDDTSSWSRGQWPRPGRWRGCILPRAAAAGKGRWSPRRRCSVWFAVVRASLILCTLLMWSWRSRSNAETLALWSGLNRFGGALWILLELWREVVGFGVVECVEWDYASVRAYLEWKDYAMRELVSGLHFFLCHKAEANY